MLYRRSAVLLGRSASAFAASPSGDVSAKNQIKTSKLQNGLLVTSIDGGSPLSRLAIVFRSGSRYECDGELGLTHQLRNCIGHDSKNYPGLQLIWETGNAGATAISQTTRDLFSVQMTVIRDESSRALSILGEMAGQPAFKHWDLVDHAETLWTDLSYLKEQPAEIVVDLLHKAAFRNGPLGNSLYINDFKVAGFSHDAMRRFAASRLVSGEAAIVGVNVDHNELLQYATEQAPIESAKGSPMVPSNYFGGEVRQLGPGDLAHVAIAGPGVGINDIKSVAVQSVLSSLLGVGPSIKYSNTCGRGIISDAVHKASSGFSYGFSAISASHSDNGLIGFYLTANGDKIGAMLKSAVDAFKSVGKSLLDEQSLAKAKKQASMNILMSCEDASNLLDDLAAQILANGSVVSPFDFIKQIEAVTATDLQQAVTKAASKLSLAAYGNLQSTQYLDEL